MTSGSRSLRVAWMIKTDIPHSAAGLRYLCVGSEHIRVGLSVPDRLGHITIHEGEWGYCSAARPDEPHAWQEIPATPLFALRHATLLKLVPSAPDPQPARTRNGSGRKAPGG